jgi:hypothetical protein
MGHEKASKNTYFFTIRDRSEGLDFTAEIIGFGNPVFPAQKLLLRLWIFIQFPTAEAVVQDTRLKLSSLVPYPLPLTPYPLPLIPVAPSP